MRKDIVKVNWSGGKDSSCAAHLHLTQGDECIIVNYFPMFTDTIPLILKEHEEFILQTAERFKKMGGQVHILHGETYWDFCHRRRVKGERVGIPFGFPPPITGACSFKVYSKEKVLSQFNKSCSFDYEDIGIAYDETKRQGQLSPSKRSILCEKKITEAAATVYCKANGIYSPHYDLFNRDGCTLCPNAPSRVREEWFKQYPEAFPLVRQLQDFVRAEIPGQYPLRKKLWFIEEDLQMSLFDEPGKTKYLIN